MTELIAVVAVVAILAAIAVPNYRRTIERNYWRQAQDLLLTIYYGEQAYYSISSPSKYRGPLSETSSMSEWRLIYMDNPNLVGAIPISYTVTTSVGDSKFTAQAKRLGGDCDTSTLKIDEARTFTPNPTTTLCWCGSC